MRRRAPRRGRGRRSHDWFGAPVARRVHRSRPSNTIGAQDLVQRGAAQHAGVEAVRFCDRQPLRKLVERRTRLGEVERTSLPKSEILAQLGRQALPERQAPDHERKLDRGATLLAHPAPVAPRLFAGDAAFLEQGDRQALACKKIGGRDADDAAADNHDVGRSRQRTYRGVPGPFVSAGSRHLRFTGQGAGLRLYWLLQSVPRLRCYGAGAPSAVEPVPATTSIALEGG